MAEMFGFKIISQYEGGIVFRFGRALPGVRQPGLIWVNPFTDRLRKVNMQIIAAAVPGQETITRDNVTMRVDAVVYYRVERVEVKDVSLPESMKRSMSRQAEAERERRARGSSPPMGSTTRRASSPRPLR